jgi:hypothetical protein
MKSPAVEYIDPSKFDVSTEVWSTRVGEDENSAYRMSISFHPSEHPDLIANSSGGGQRKNASSDIKHTKQVVYADPFTMAGANEYRRIRASAEKLGLVSSGNFDVIEDSSSINDAKKTPLDKLVKAFEQSGKESAKANGSTVSSSSSSSSSSNSKVNAEHPKDDHDTTQSVSSVNSTITNEYTVKNIDMPTSNVPDSRAVSTQKSVRFAESSKKEVSPSISPQKPIGLTRDTSISNLINLIDDHSVQPRNPPYEKISHDIMQLEDSFHLNKQSTEANSAADIHGSNINETRSKQALHKTSPVPLDVEQSIESRQIDSEPIQDVSKL